MSEKYMRNEKKENKQLTKLNGNKEHSQSHDNLPKAKAQYRLMANARLLLI